MKAAIFITYNPSSVGDLELKLLLEQLSIFFMRIYLCNVVICDVDYINVKKFPTLVDYLSIRLYLDQPIDEDEAAHLTFCKYMWGTIKDKTLAFTLAREVERYYLRGEQINSVVVVDLDDVLIDKINQLRDPHVKDFLGYCLERFDYCILWSHGTSKHVAEALKKHNLSQYFSMTLSRDVLNENPDTKKGFGYVLYALNKQFGTTETNFSCLVDDQRENFNEDYSLFIRVDPTKKLMLEYIDIINNVYLNHQPGSVVVYP